MQELASKRNIRTANATLKGGREEQCVINSLDASYVLFKKVLQLFMTEVVGARVTVCSALTALTDVNNIKSWTEQN